MEEERIRFLPASLPGESRLSLQPTEKTPPRSWGEFRETLFSKAFLVVPGPEYNRISYEMRGAESVRKLTFYEVVLLRGQKWTHLRERIYPELARYLKSKSLSLKSPEGVVVSLFYEDSFHLIDAANFLQAYREIEGIDVGTFQWRARQWLAG